MNHFSEIVILCVKAHAHPDCIDYGMKGPYDLLHNIHWVKIAVVWSISADKYLEEPKQDTGTL